MNGGVYRTLTNGAATMHDARIAHMLGSELKQQLLDLRAQIYAGASTVALDASVQRSLRSIENILLAQQAARGQLELRLQPVHIGASLQHVLYAIHDLSRQYDCEMTVTVLGRVAAVDVDRQVLQAALESLTQAVLSLTRRPSPIHWQIERDSKGQRVRMSVLNAHIKLTNIHFEQAASQFRTEQSFKAVAGPASDLRAAHQLFKCLGGDLRTTRRHGTAGMTVSLRATPQLALL